MKETIYLNVAIECACWNCFLVESSKEEEDE